MNVKASVPIGVLFCVGVILLSASGCARWINGNAGEKGMQLGRGQQGEEVEVPLEYGQHKVTEDMPSLSQSRRPDPFNLGDNSREERIPNDPVVVSPSMSSGSHRGPYGEGL